MSARAPTDGLVLAALRCLVREELEVALRERQEAGQRPEGYLTTREAARRAGVAQDTVLAWISKGILQATRPQGVKGWKIRPADLEAALSATEVGGDAPLKLEDARAARAAVLAAAARKGGGR